MTDMPTDGLLPFHAMEISTRAPGHGGERAVGLPSELGEPGAPPAPRVLEAVRGGARRAAGLHAFAKG